jgi:hypothetical protein
LQEKAKLKKRVKILDGSICKNRQLCWPQLTNKPARVAKLVDAPGLGPDGGNTVGVRVPPRAPSFLFFEFLFFDKVTDHGRCS